MHASGTAAVASKNVSVSIVCRLSSLASGFLLDLNNQLCKHNQPVLLVVHQLRSKSLPACAVTNEESAQAMRASLSRRRVHSEPLMEYSVYREPAVRPRNGDRARWVLLNVDVILCWI